MAKKIKEIIFHLRKIRTTKSFKITIDFETWAKIEDEKLYFQNLGFEIVRTKYIYE